MKEKNRSTNKNIFRIVAILLCIVLFTTSIVSGTLAKFAIKKDATTTVTFKKFGLQLSILKGANWDNTVMTMSPDTSQTANKNAASVTVTGVQLVPNQTLDEVVKFDIAVVSGATVSVNTRIKVSATIESASNLASSSASSAPLYLPVKFTAKKNGGSSAQIAAPWQTAANVNDLKTTVNSSLKSGLKTFLGTGATEDGNFACIKIANANDAATSNLVIQTLGFGFTCPATSDVTNSDEFMTYIAEKGGTFNIKYTVVLEQIV